MEGSGVLSRQDIKSMTLEELKKIFLQLKLPAFRALQVYQWLHQKAVSSFDEMKNLPKGLREVLAEQYACLCGNCAQADFAAGRNGEIFVPAR